MCSTQDSAGDDAADATRTRSTFIGPPGTAAASLTTRDKLCTSSTRPHHVRRTESVIWRSSVSTRSRLTFVAVRHHVKCSSSPNGTTLATINATSALRSPILG